MCLTDRQTHIVNPWDLLLDPKPILMKISVVDETLILTETLTANTPHCLESLSQMTRGLSMERIIEEMSTVARENFEL